jgi:hypothetical protein
MFRYHVDPRPDLASTLVRNALDVMKQNNVEEVRQNITYWL